ncbi:beta-ketoacyl synthase N-terminal-like domain-containing protein [Pontibacter akesuensis]|uniref:3-oxoacyl-(Acyl-carrier-protein) synthase n=1 Tax=Pontibacter akesuensis TaxID=388950 RepID=A0A1I7KFK7_9BACT|nr:beta-ketoacyl synthase N-terminal-like domain-containing protein [Pontibacter akesuensis]GHA79568.1 beta-ketoacyl synthase [Pontibacter akesuensis]SFU96189.1 3-oxoacyl-(acyl-carrier-protein) synthase [Pontibacter akesuensis]
MEQQKQHIVIRGCGVISPLGFDAASIAQAYLNGTPAFTQIPHQGTPTPVAALPAAAELQLQQLVHANPTYKQLDRSVLLAMYAAKQAASQAGWLQENFTSDDDLAVNIGSSRGATGLFEQHFEAFQQEQLSSSASPTTTLGNLSSWVAHAVNAGGAQISHSITCSTALMAVANGVAWLKAGMAKRFLAGGTEAPLTDFTIAQMKAVSIYSKLYDHPYPCQPYAQEKQNTFTLGEGAAVFALEQINQPKAGAVCIEAVGLGFEKLTSKTGISAEGLNFQKAMRQALAQLPEQDRSVDLIITHTPGTRAGDKAELTAIQAVFGSNLPSLTTNKWLIGHTLGASGALSMQYALHILQRQHVPSLPYPHLLVQQPALRYRRIMINAAGFGGNAASIVVGIL